VIQWSENFETMLRETLSPAKLDYIIKHEAEKRVEVYVEEDQRALAIGKNGQNVRLAGIILGWEIDILNTAELSSNADDKAKKEEVAEEKVEASETPVAEEKIETPEVVAEEKKE
jgi:N utilization substance protein A